MTSPTTAPAPALLDRFHADLASLGKSFRTGQYALVETGMEIEPLTHLLVNAPTSTGKSLGALMIGGYRAELGQRTIIGTFTKLLQDQYAGEDLDDAKKLFPNVRFAVLKGSMNYLCRVNARAGKGSGSDYTALKNGTGDPGEAYGAGLWMGRADAEKCAGHNAEECGFVAAKKRARDAHVVITNHTLILLNSQMPDIFGRHSLLIVDEAHNFPRAAESFSSIVIDLDKALAEITPSATGEDEGRPTDDRIADAYKIINEIGKALAPREEAYAPTAEQVVTAITLYKKIDRSVTDMSDELGNLKRWLTWAHKAHAFRSAKHPYVAVVKEGGKKKVKARKMELGAVDIASAARRGLSTVLEFPVRVSKDEDGTEQDTTPDNVHRAVLLMSATTGTPERPTFVAERCGIAEAELVACPAALDYKGSMRVSLVPSHKELADDIVKLVVETSGRTLVLLRSWASVEEVGDALEGYTNLKVYRQNRENPGMNAATVAEFREDTASVLVGTMSFFEGINVPGESLSQVIIGKLPVKFAFDPINRERVRQAGIGYMEEQQIPHTALVLEQMMGRLIRATTDRGLVVVMDPAAKTGWGYRSLVAATHTFGINVIPRTEALAWFNNTTV